jgi:hypothetical protein
MRSSILLVACAAVVLAGAADAKSKPRRKPPASPPRVWLLLNADGRTAALRYGFGNEGDPRRTNLTCEDSGVIKVEQFVSGRGGATLVIDSAGESVAAAAETRTDSAEGTTATGVAATFAIDQPVMQAFSRTGSLRLAVGAQSIILPPAPQDDVRRFMEHCAP